METSLKTGFPQIFSRCPKNLSCPKSGGAAAPLASPGPYAYESNRSRSNGVHNYRSKREGEIQLFGFINWVWKVEYKVSKSDFRALALAFLSE